MSEEQLWSIPDDVESIYIHYTTEELLKGFREEALRHREEIKKLKEQNKMLKEAVKEKVIATCNTCEDYGICPHSYREYDLDNIINELEKYIVYQLQILNNPEDYYAGTYVREVLYRLKELKGEDKE